MRQSRIVAIATVLSLPVAAFAQNAAPSAAIRGAVAAKSRAADDVARDRYRHPAETLAFFGVKPGDTLVEFIPGGGWYTDILAPLVRGNGRYIALVPTSAADRTKTMLAGKAATIGRTDVATLDGATGTSTLPAASVDTIVTFRNVHNLLMGSDLNTAANAFKAFYAALKPGGTLGVVDHRLPEEMDVAKEKTSGYIKRSTVVRLAEQAGFRLAGESRINANAKDTHDHPEGVWTLPPSYRLKDVDRAKYQAIGESDRFTLKFVKPAK